MTTLKTRTFTLTELDDLEVRPWSPEILATETGEVHSWHTDLALVFEYDGRCWAVNYMHPNTEAQEDQDRWHTVNAPAGPSVVAREVERRFTMVEHWQPVADDAPEPAGEMSIFDIIGKLGYEGGLTAGLAYGLRSGDLSEESRAQFPEAARAWDRVCAAWEAFDLLAHGEFDRAISPIEDELEREREREYLNR